MERGYALVTGASQGIGRAIALELAAKGFGTIASARSRDKLEETVRACSAINGGRAIALEADLAVPGGADLLAEAVLATGLPVQALVNNAGYAVWGRFVDRTMEEHQAMLRVNTLAPLQLTHRLLPLLREHPRSYVLNTGSMAGYTALATLAGYAAGKAFLRLWSRALRIELRDSGVAVCCVCPGTVLTGFTQRAGMGPLEKLAQRFGKPPEPIAKAAVRALLAGRAEVVPGLLDRITATAMKLAPDALAERIASGIYLGHLPEGSREEGPPSTS